MSMTGKAVILLSGGLDSAVALYEAKGAGYGCHALAFDYGQRHKVELQKAAALASRAGAAITTVTLPFTWKGSILVGAEADLPRNRPLDAIRADIPSTYVPARNTVFLSVAVSFAEAIGAAAVYIGAHAEDASGYPDCRKPYLEAFDAVVRLGTKAGLEGRLAIRYPLIDMNKSRIIRRGAELDVPFELTWSCYAGGAAPCGECDSCILRAKGFREAGLADPLMEGAPCMR